MKLYEKRVLISKLFADACDSVFASYDFEKHARKVGMLMTILENHDDGINIQGHGPVPFTDADGGEVRNPSDDEEEVEDEDISIGDKDNPPGYDSDDTQLTDDGMNDLYDDTLPAKVVRDVGAPRVPRGYEIDDSALKHVNDVIGKHIMFLFAGGDLHEDDLGWYLAKVKSQLTQADKAKYPKCTHYAVFDVKDSPHNQVLLNAHKQKGRKLDNYRISTSAESRGLRWVLLKKI